MDVIWKEAERRPDLEAMLSRDLSLSPLTARLLVNRAIYSSQDAGVFLHPDLSHLYDPFLLPDMDRAAHRIAEAITRGESIFVHGDYDVDGVTSTALYVRALKRLGATPLYRIPHRQNDGYDLKIRAVESAFEQGAKLVITTDCGIQAREAVAHANSLGLEVIITDHHEPGEILPPAYAVVNPRRHDSQYPFPSLAGVGVAFKTMQAVTRLLKPDWEQSFIRNFLDLVAFGTIADVMPLRDENRIFVSFGLEAMRLSKKVGLRALILGSGIDIQQSMTTDSVAFWLAPRINAAGRLDDAAVALELLLTTDESEAKRLVERLNEVNQERQQTQRRVTAEAVLKVMVGGLNKRPVIIVASPEWNSGVVGIVAGKLVEQFHRPAIVIGVSSDGSWGKGSARSIPAFDMFKGVSLCRDLLETCGGHSYAAGLSLSMDRFTDFESRLCEHAAEVLTEEDFRPLLEIDAIIDPEQINFSLLEEWEQLQPFGEANPSPVLASRGIACRGVRKIGKDNTHLKLCVEHGQGAGKWYADGVAWGKAQEWEQIMASGESIEIAYMPTINNFNGRTSLQLVIKDIHESSKLNDE